MSAFTIPDIITKVPTGQPINPDGVAYVFDDHPVGYAALADRSQRLARALVVAGLGKGDRVGVLMRNRPEWLEAFFGVTGAGGAVVPLNYLLRSGELEFILTDCDARWLIYEGEFAQAATELASRMVNLNIIGVDDPDAYPALLADAADTTALPDLGPDDLALLQYTSGTTGHPKGAMHTHATVLWNSYHQIADFGITRDDVCQVTPALCWAAGFHDLALATLWAGGRLVLERGSFDPAVFLRNVEQHRVTSTLLVPTVLKRVLAEPSFGLRDLSSLRLIISGGEPVPITASEDMHQRLPGCDVLQVYGLSEFPTLMLLLPAADAARKAGSTGKACSIAQVRVVNSNGEQVSPGEVGEIMCRSPAVTRGYFGRPEATHATLADGWLHTGDLATVDEDGYLFVSGRAKDMIITGGLNVYPAEVERVLAQHPGITEAAVVGVSDEQWGEVGWAHVVVANGQRLDETELVPWLRGQLASYKVPREYIFRAELLPRTTSGKVQKFLLRDEE